MHRRSEVLARRARRRKRGAFLKVRFQGREKAKRARLGEALEDRASRRRPVSKEGDKLAMAGSKDLELSVAQTTSPKERQGVRCVKRQLSRYMTTAEIARP